MVLKVVEKTAGIINRAHSMVDRNPLVPILGCELLLLLLWLWLLLVATMFDGVAVLVVVRCHTVNL